MNGDSPGDLTPADPVATDGEQGEELEIEISEAPPPDDTVKIDVGAQPLPAGAIAPPAAGGATPAARAGRPLAWRLLRRAPCANPPASPPPSPSPSPAAARARSTSDRASRAPRRACKAATAWPRRRSPAPATISS